MFGESRPIYHPKLYSFMDGKTTRKQVPDLSFISLNMLSILALLLALVLNYLRTTIQSEIAVRRRKVAKHPPVMPYCMPYISHALDFAWDMGSLATQIR